VSAVPLTQATPECFTSSTSRMHSTGRLLSLDVLRGLAVLLVLFRHPVLPPEEAGAFAPVAQLLHRFGWTGVDLFFVLSGFLVGGLLFQEISRHGQLKVGRFLLRRGLKIWPAYCVFLVVASVKLVRHSSDGIDSLRLVIPNLLHLQNYLGTPFGITWTLAVEEHFYLLLPLVLFSLIRRRGPDALESVPVIAGLTMAVCLLLRCITNLGQPFDSGTHVAHTHLRIDSLFFGVLLAYWHHYRPDVRARFKAHQHFLMPMGVALICPMMFLDISHPFVWTAGFSLLYLGYGSILLGCLYAAPIRKNIMGLIASRLTSVVAGLGFFSYSVYLWHADLALSFLGYRLRHDFFTHALGAVRWPVGMCVYILAAATIGVVMARLIEIPALKFRDKCFPSQSST
jgi:peptidoglycan/LPS O-acetylase OafA/YrhL